MKKTQDHIPPAARFQLEIMSDPRSGYPTAFAPFADRFLRDSSIGSRDFWAHVQKKINVANQGAWQDFLYAIMKPVMHPEQFKIEIKKYYKDAESRVHAVESHARNLHRSIGLLRNNPDGLQPSGLNFERLRELLNELIRGCEEVPEAKSVMQDREGWACSQKKSGLDFARQIRDNLNRLYSANKCLSVLNEANWEYLMGIICPGEFAAGYDFKAALRLSKHE